MKVIIQDDPIAYLLQALCNKSGIRCKITYEVNTYAYQGDQKLITKLDINEDDFAKAMSEVRK